MESHKNGGPKNRNIRKIYFKGWGQLFIIGLDIFGFVIAATFLFLLPGAVHRTALHGFLLMAGLCLAEKRHVLQFALAIVFVDYKAGRADEEEKGEDDMCCSADQMNRFLAKVQINSGKCLYNFGSWFIRVV